MANNANFNRNSLRGAFRFRGGADFDKKKGVDFFHQLLPVGAKQELKLYRQIEVSMKIQGLSVVLT